MKFNPDLANRENERIRLEAKLASKNPSASQELQSSSPQEFWSLSGVRYGCSGSTYTLDLSASLLEGGKPEAYAHWSNYPKSRPNEMAFSPMDLPLIYSLSRTMYHKLISQKVNTIEEMRAFILSAIEKGLMTCTAAVYTQQGITFNHNSYGRELDGPHILGKHRIAQSPGALEVCQKLFDSDDDALHMYSVLNWMSGKAPLLVLPDFGPLTPRAHPATLYLRDANLVIDLQSDKNSTGVALGARLRLENPLTRP